MDPSLQQELIIRHYRRPRHRGRLEAPSGTARVTNPFCGDEVTIDVRVADGRLVEASFDGRGCTISQASASMLMSRIQESRLEDVRGLAHRFTAFVKGEEGGGEEDMRELAALQGVTRFPTRVRCALLAVEALLEALADAGVDSVDPESGVQQGKDGVDESSG